MTQMYIILLKIPLNKVKLILNNNVMMNNTTSVCKDFHVETIKQQ